MTVCTPWATLDDLPDKYAALNCEEGVTPWLLVASTILYNFTGERWRGDCEDTIRPTQCNIWCRCRDRWDLVGDRWWFRRGPGSDGCGCGAVAEFVLPNSPVRDVIRVTVDGETLDESAYRIDDGRKLVRLDGHQWPCCQVVEREITELGTWEVWYRYGADPPPEAVAFAAILGAELFKASTFATDCRLPSNTQTVTRQSVSVTMANPSELFPEGFTGIPAIDMWLGSLSYARKHRRARAMVPGASSRFRRTGAPGGS